VNARGSIYQKVGNLMVRPLLMNTTTPAFYRARAFYRQFPDLSFEDDLVEYMRTGYVCIRPNLFALARPIEHEGERMWFIRFSLGSLAELITVLPCYTDKICFCRNNRADKMRIVSTKRLSQLALRQARKGQV
jgi:hypothetical protein